MENKKLSREEEKATRIVKFLNKLPYSVSEKLIECIINQIDFKKVLEAKSNIENIEKDIATRKQNRKDNDKLILDTGILGGLSGMVLAGCKLSPIDLTDFILIVASTTGLSVIGVLLGALLDKGVHKTQDCLDNFRLWNANKKYNKHISRNYRYSEVWDKFYGIDDWNKIIYEEDFDEVDKENNI